MSWSKLHGGAHRHRKVLRLEKALGVEVLVARGIALSLWSWTIETEPDGDLSDYRPEELATALGWSGDASEFVRALIACGLLDSNPDGLFVHDWMEYAEGWKDAQRKRSERKRKRRDSRPENVQDAARTVQDAARTVRKTARERRGEERRGEERDLAESPADAGSPPAPIDDPEVLSYPVVGGGEWSLRMSLLTVLGETYPGVDIEAEIRKARVWCVTEKAKRKTAAGMPAFLRNWFQRAQNDAAERAARGAGRGRGPLTIAERQLAETDAVIAAMRARGQARPTDTARLLPVRAPPEPPTHPTAPSAPTRDLFDASEDPC